ncbi:MAG TPA: hypothetical protein PLP05_08715 [Sedimentisphaerales bacterium]|nr:hypothetical protein [Sedimentisphaerales bacterium]
MAKSTNSQTPDEKVIQAIGKYEKDNPKKEGIPPRNLEDGVGLELAELKPILEKLLESDLVEAIHLAESRPDFRIWHQLPANVEQEQVKTAYEANFRFRLSSEGHKRYYLLPELTEQRNSPLDLLKYPISCVDVAAIVREKSHNIASKLKRRNLPVVQVARKNYCEVGDAIILYPIKKSALEKYKKPEN